MLLFRFFAICVNGSRFEAVRHVQQAGVKVWYNKYSIASNTIIALIRSIIIRSRLLLDSP